MNIGAHPRHALTGHDGFFARKSEAIKRLRMKEQLREQLDRPLIPEKQRVREYGP